ncbi:bifunctional serine/threonine-protein kinase/formylglycine-generating enzyme family protein [Luteimonas sp. FCS-9]|uniref:bifunctional serine/threonine-protein kinase/formylglycine-generating enzyme family protein n=1 Tax=Luteimonas sp. FCS-9 TaxID=1547516 RepID=UPI00069B01E8|nr:bifunctional serine/threonine-protein kinase/formylglycine-generating enzyme family protein [Luteimonas sp. FCS-9]
MSQTTIGYESPAPPRIAGYRIVRVIGHGGMATVYLGTQLSLGRDVAIKVMRPEALADEVSRRRFENETRTIARLEHPHIVGIHDVGRTDDGLPWYAMPHLPHGHLGQRDLRGDQARVRAVLHALLSALAYAHARGVIHRDVKAENVLFDEADRPLLADFGIALRRGYGTRMTMVGLAVGSTAYMAPEQARGQQVDFRADLYSVGVLAWEMLTGALPFEGEDALSMALAHVQNPVPRLPPALRHWQRFIDQALAKSPKRRFSDAAQMLDALAQVPQRDGEPRITGSIRRIGRGGRRLLPWLAVPVVVLAGLGTWRWLDRREAAPAPADDAPPAAAVATATPPPVQDASSDAGADDAGPAAAPDATPVAGIEAPRAAPVSEADRHLAAAERLLQAGRLAAPADDNALERLDRARVADAQHLRLPALTARVFDAVGTRAAALIARRDDGAAADLLQAARAHAVAPAEIAALQPVRAKVADAIEARIADAVTAVDRDDAVASLAGADAIGLDAATKARLRRGASAIPDLNALAARIAGGARVVRSGDAVFAISSAPVSRNEYAAFVAATGRKSAPCRARGSVLRALAPRDWEAPGFDQAPGDPVVCVSWHDAVDYARWRSEREGRSIVVASTAQGAAAPTAADGPAEWRSDCAAACKDRVAAGRSRRDDLDSRALDPRRGYDDVGFRLVHLP